MIHIKEYDLAFFPQLIKAVERMHDRNNLSSWNDVHSLFELERVLALCNILLISS